MTRKLTTIALTLVICLLGVTSISLANLYPIRILSAQQAKELGSWPTLQQYEKVTGSKIEKFNEAPMLRAKVAAGELPPVEERLPEEPMVVEPIDQIGQYGGIAHTATIRVESYGDDTIIMGCEGVLRTARDAKSVVPNIAKDWDFSDDGKTFTLYLRKGLKWSDGVPFTADDILFWYEDVMLNKELSPVIAKEWRPGGKVMEMEKIDDYTVRVHFAVPNPGILMFDGPIRGGWTWCSYPKHYLKQFHPRYTPVEKLNKMVKEAGYDYWYQLFNKKASACWNTPLNPDLPTLCAYVITEKSTNRRVYERNPYYWKIDPAGNQLPYIDKVVANIVQDREMINTMIVQGQLDVCIQETSIENYPLYQENEKQGNYRTLLWQSVLGSDVNYFPNLTYKKDLVLRDIFRDVRFRRALSLAINREEINDIIYFGLGVPRQMTAIPQSVAFEEKFAKAYAQYDPEEANRLLDEMGLKWDKDHKWRLRPDGKRLAWVLEYFPVETPKGPVTELVKEYWAAIGCDVEVKELTGELNSERYRANAVQMGLWHGDRCTDILFPREPMWVVPTSDCWAIAAWQLWAKWFLTGGKIGEEPPEECKRNLELWKKTQTTMDEKEKVRLTKEIWASQARNLWAIGTVGCAPHPVIVANNLRNFPEKGLHGWDVVWTCYLHPEQFFFEQK